MSINYPLLQKNISKKKTFNSKDNKHQRTISSNFHSKKKINLEDIFGGIFFKRGKNQKRFDGNDIMKEALNIGKRITAESIQQNKDDSYIKYADELIQNTQISARSNFIENISKKFKLRLHNDFTNTLIKSTDEGVIQLEKKLDEIDKTKFKYEMALNENATLEQKLVDINNDLRIISHNLFEKNLLINKEQIKNESFKIIQPIFEELIREFPDEDPKELISSFRRNKEKYLSQIHELNKLNMRINDIENERKNEEKKNSKFQSNIKDKILQQKQLTDSMVNHFEKEYKIYKDEHEILLNYTKENIVLRQLLYNIFSWIKSYIHPKKYEIFVKKLGYNPLNKKKKFDITIFNNKEFVSLVNENILSNVTTCYDGELLRTTIVFGNYLVRRHLNKKNKFRYDPVSTFREIKSVIDAKEFENYQLSGIIKNLNQKKINSHLKIKELEHQVQKAKIKYQVLLTKFQKYIKLTNKIKNQNKNKIEEIKKEEKKRSSSAYPTLVKSRQGYEKLNTLQLKRKLKEKKISEIKLKNDKKENEKENKNIDNKNRKTVNGFYTEKRKFFLTSDGQKGKKKFKEMDTINEEKNINDKFVNKNNFDIKTRFKMENMKTNESFDKYSDLNSIDKEILLEINNKSDLNQKIKRINNKKLLDLQISKNRDKLIKTNGFNGTENLLMNIKNIMNEVIYSENPKQLIDNFQKDKSKNYESIKQNKKIYPYLERFKDFEKDKQLNDFKTINKNIKRPFTSIPQITYGKDYNDISNKIMGDIDNIITKINEIDLHDFSTDQNYKDKRKLNLFSKMDKETTEKKKNSIDSLLIKEDDESSIKSEENDEEEDEIDKKDIKENE